MAEKIIFWLLSNLAVTIGVVVCVAWASYAYIVMSLAKKASDKFLERE